MDDIIKEFLIESYENLDQLERDLVNLEKSPNSPDLIASIFRTIHTIKGTSGFLALGKLEALAHVAENLLSRLRDGKLVLNGEITGALLESVDDIREMLSNIEANGTEGDGDYTALIATLARLQDPSKQATPAAPFVCAEAAQHAPAVEAGHAPVEAHAPVPEPAPAPAPVKAKGGHKQAAHAEGAVPKAVVGGAAAKTSAPETAAPIPFPPAQAANAAKGKLEPSSPKPMSAKPNSEAHVDSAAVSNSSIRIDVSVLDRLMNLVGELVLSRNQILQVTDKINDSNFGAMSQRLNLITTELQEIAMKTRMQPIGNIWAKLPRMVRDVASDLGKRVELEMSGNETELDRSVIEAIKDPLTHIIRNSVDHGIEAPALRAERNKPEVSILHLRAFHESGQVNIELADDGSGIDPARIRAKVLEKNLLRPEEVNRMSDGEVIHLIFLPGFSTAEKVTNVSGRGVGMDVVKTNVEKIGGTVEISSRLGQGTLIRIRIPLTLAIIPALIVEAANERYAIPQANLVELLRVGEGSGTKQIEYIHGTPVYRLRGKLLPVLLLNKELGLGQDSDEATRKALNLVVLRAGERQFGLLVATIHDSAEIVVKPLAPCFKNLTCYAGATIMGDGKVALILDVAGLANRAQLQDEAAATNTKKEVIQFKDREQEHLQRLLLFELGPKENFAIALSAVARLEEFDLNAIEHTGHGEVIQYRGEILPLLRIGNVLAGHDSAHAINGSKEQAVIYSENGRSVGLVVGHIQDVVEQVVDLKQTGCRPGIIGTAVIQKRVTEFLDVPAVIRAADPSFYQPIALATVA